MQHHRRESQGVLAICSNSVLNELSLTKGRKDERNPAGAAPGANAGINWFARAPLTISFTFFLHFSASQCKQRLHYRRKPMIEQGNFWRTRRALASGAIPLIKQEKTAKFGQDGARSGLVNHGLTAINHLLTIVYHLLTMSAHG
jgi:hypothetical protein